ncbi:Na/Pi symporter [Marinoscillum pacificum]|uniref:Na/Pi symporter n=1 Tax=Marinoscillum pacificum TaxID=392723 RepID=UPI0021571627|nr:Na/Pi symporter [Marinoscillum pacificum]
MQNEESIKSYSITNIVGIILSIVGFFVSIHFLGMSFQTIGSDFSQNFEIAFGNPAIGLFIGLLGTAILQSSSTTTSMAVAAVAAGTITLENAIPVVMGANIGTTLTSTIVSMSYVTKTAEFKKAVTAGTCHDIFNVLTCIILFPLELKYGVLSQLSHSLASLFDLSTANSPETDKFFIYTFLDKIGTAVIGWVGGFVLLVISIIGLFGTVKAISNISYNQLIGPTRTRFEAIAFQNTFRSFGWGFLLTAIIQSSSITTSLIVPLVATSKVSVNRAFQFVVGSNIGTTITAILAALFKSEAAMSLAFAHFLFNMAGMILFMGVPLLRKLPLYLADKLGSIALRFKLSAFAYILILFFVLPFTLIYFSKTEKQTPPAVATEEVSSNN